MYKTKKRKCVCLVVLHSPAWLALFIDNVVLFIDDVVLFIDDVVFVAGSIVAYPATY